jgi:hypothetical protein
MEEEAQSLVMGVLDLGLLSESHPDISITVKVADLARFGREIAAEAVATARKELHNEDRLISTSECAEMLGCTTRTLLNIEKAGLLTSAKSGGNKYYRYSDIQRYIAECFKNN